MRHLHLLLVCTIYTSIYGVAQSPALTDFRLAGDATRSGDRCIQLTHDWEWSSGSIWYNKAISLKSPFSMELKVMLGCKNQDGADGMVFVFHPHDRRVGYGGEGMGFAGLRPSIGIEIDTWENGHLGDPVQDHVALLRDGQVAHYHNLEGPNPIPNIEDCSEHDLRINWQPEQEQLLMYIDNRQVLFYQGDLIQDVFRGNEKVYWGITSGTGAYSNRQSVCIEKLDFALMEDIPRLELDGPKADKLIKGEFISLNNIKFESGSANLLPASKRELDEMARIMKKYPRSKLDILGHTDNVGSAANNLRLSERRAKAVADYLRSKGIPEEQLNSRGLGEDYPKHSNNSATGRLKNRRVEFRLSKPIV
jgi:outer membrane protein OmpA-like peptidoglycan-associated protein